jgi:hypothetical protein
MRVAAVSDRRARKRTGIQKVGFDVNNFAIRINAAASPSFLP